MSLNSFTPAGLQGRPSSHGTAQHPMQARLLPGRIGVLALTLCLTAFSTALAQDHQHHHQPAPSAQDGYARTLATYKVPDVKLLDTNGASVSLNRELAGQDRPVILNFIYTTCTSVCPVMSATFSQVQASLGPQRNAVRMVSISIDPEQDTPAVLKAYAGKFDAGPQWQMLTGSLQDSIAVQRAFNVYRGDKMGHTPATFLRAKAGQPWVRLDGFASANDIVREYRQFAKR